MLPKRIVCLAVTAGLGFGLTTPAFADELRPMYAFPGGSFIQGETYVRFGCWNMTGGVMPQIQAFENNQWNPVATGSSDLPAGYEPGICGAGYRPIYYSWQVNSWGQENGISGESLLQVRQAIPATSTVVNERHSGYIATYKCKRGVRGLWRWRSVKVNPPRAVHPVYVNVRVHRCAGAIKRKTYKPAWATVPVATVTPEVTGSTSTVKVITAAEAARRLALALCKAFGSC